MTSVQYLHCSFAGSYWIDCEVIRKEENFQPPLNKTQLTQVAMTKLIRKEPIEFTDADNFNEVGLWYEIRFTDPNSEETEVRWVRPEMLKFPKFSDYNC